MKTISRSFPFAFFLSCTIWLTEWKPLFSEWLREVHPDFSLYYQQPDAGNKQAFTVMIRQGMQQVHDFFNKNYSSSFNVYLHPGRKSLDSTWQHDWQMPGFASECWMVGSGVAGRLDWLSSRNWQTEACEHNPADTISMQQVITHELVHVFHGQLNASPDFSNTTNIDWFVEGLATYASGQCDETKVQQVATAIRNGQTPDSLSKFWTGKLRYALAGSLLKYIDAHYGRKILTRMLPWADCKDLLQVLEVSEKTLLADWKEYITTLSAGH